MAPHLSHFARGSLPRAANNEPEYVELGVGQIILSRTTFVVVITVCIFLTCLSMLGLFVFAYREWTRRRQNEQARIWAKKSASSDRRITLMRKAVDDEYSRQFSGCLTNSVVENPFLVVGEPVELGEETRLFEAPAVPARAWSEDDGSISKAKRMTQQRVSLWFDGARGLWVPKK